MIVKPTRVLALVVCAWALPVVSVAALTTSP